LLLAITWRQLMPSLSDIKDLWDLFIGLVVAHPYAAFLATLISIYILNCHLQHRLKRQFKAFWKSARSIPIQGHMCSFAAIGVFSFLVIHYTYSAHRIKPELIDLYMGQRILAEDFTIKWQYDAEEPGTVYEVEILNLRSKNRHVSKTSLKRQKIVVHGPLRVTVRATSPQEGTVSSMPVDIEYYRDSIDRIRKTGVLQVGVHEDNMAGVFCYMDGQSGQLRGADIDLSQAIASKLAAKYNMKEIKPVFVPLEWDDVIFAPARYGVDFSIASISIKPDRSKTIDFSEPYWTSHLAVVQRASKVEKNYGGQDIFKLNEFFSIKNVGVHVETTAEDLAMHLSSAFPNLVIHTALSNNDLFGMLGQNIIDAVIYDCDRTLTYTRQNPNWITRRLSYEGLAIQPEQYGLTFAKINDSLKKDVDELLPSIEVRSLLHAHVNETSVALSH
jgi:glutamine transport system substrate-binding protein